MTPRAVVLGCQDTVTSAPQTGWQLFVLTATAVGATTVPVSTVVVTVTASEKVAEAGMLLPISTATVSPMRVRTRRGMLMLGLLSLVVGWDCGSGDGERLELDEPRVRQDAAAGVVGDRLADRGD